MSQEKIENPEILKAINAFSQNKFHEAIDLYKKAISLNNNFSEAYNNLANTQKIMGDNANATYNYIHAIKSNKSKICNLRPSNPR